MKEAIFLMLFKKELFFHSLLLVISASISAYSGIRHESALSSNDRNCTSQLEAPREFILETPAAWYQLKTHAREGRVHSAIAKRFQIEEQLPEDWNNRVTITA